MRRASNPDSELTEELAPPRRVGVVVSHVLLFASFPGMFAYFFLPIFVRSSLCPGDTFLSGSVGSDVAAAGAIILGFGGMVLSWSVSPSAPVGWAPQYAYMVGVQAWIQNNRMLSTILASAGLIAAGVIWVNWTFAYYCATPKGVLLHPSALGGYRQFGWNDVRAADVDCWEGTKGSSHGALVLRFSDNESVRLDPSEMDFHAYNSPHRRRGYLTIRQALAGHKFRFTISDAKDCPGHIRTYWFVWPHAGA